MKKPIIAILAIFSLTLILSMGITFAYGGERPFKQMNYDEEVHTQLKVAIDACDYEEWVSIREANDLPMYGKIHENINEDNFGLFCQLHDAVQNGDTETAMQIKEQLGFKMGRMGKFKGMVHGGPGMHGECGLSVNCPMQQKQGIEEFCQQKCGCQPTDGE